MLKIDSHQHFWVYDPVKDSWITDEMAAIKNDFLPGRFKQVLEENGVNGCVAIQADQSETETMFLIEQAADNPFIKGVVGWVDLRADNIATCLAHFSNFPIVKGFRHIIEAEKDLNFMLGEKFKNGISCLKAYDFTYDLLIKPAHLPVAARLVSLFPNQLFVIDHLAKPNIRSKDFKEWEIGLKAIAAYPNVYCKISGFGTQAVWHNWGLADVSPYFDVAFKLFGADRVMFGSDWPVLLLACTYNKTMDVFADYLKDFSVTELQKFWAGNAISFYGLN